jgi:hypothetical protein
MNKRELVRAFAIASVSLLGLLLSNSIVSCSRSSVAPGALASDTGGDRHATGDPLPWIGPVPKAQCSPGDWTESGLQGQTTPDERYSGDSEGGYNCNLELVGQY